MDNLLIILFVLIIYSIIFWIIYYVLKKKNKQFNSELLYINETKSKIESFYLELNELKKNYIRHSDYLYLQKKYKYLYDEINSRKKNLFSGFTDDYSHLAKNIKKYNDLYVEKELKDNKIFFDTILDYPLDNDQRLAIIKNDDSNIIIAGAGSGKTSTLIGKIKYLVDIKKVNPDEILSISYNNSTVNDFTKKLKDENLEKVKCTNFHKLAKNTILEYNGKVADGLIDKVIFDYLHNTLYNDSEKLKQIVYFFGLYLHYPNTEYYSSLGDMYDYEYDYDLETLKSKYIRYKNGKDNLTTMKNEKVKSYEELMIANYLYLHGIEYEYEKKYDEEFQYNPDFYLTEYDIYLEHFGINEKGKCPQYSKEEEKKYLEEMEWKRKIHEENNTCLIETYSYQVKNNTLFNILEKELNKHGVILKDVNLKDIYNAIIIDDNRDEFTSFKNLIKKFISIFKGNNYNESDFNNYYDDSRKKNNFRNIILLDIIYDIYKRYKQELINKDEKDFDDLINDAIKKVNQDGFKTKLKYIIVDEFQDTSKNRFLLINSIIKNTNAILVVVGDDWQSIYRFSGCDLGLFINFDKYVGFSEKMYINNTYRNCQELIDIAGNFIMKNPNQIKKKLISKSENSDLKKSIKVFYYKDDIKIALDCAIKELRNIGCNKIAILGRNNSDFKKLNINNYKGNEDTDCIELGGDYKGVYFYTIHKSKGLEFDGTIICNMNNYISGFPNKMADDPIINYVTDLNDEYPFEEERRLFYVALTRTKTKCFLLVPTNKQSFFATELMTINDLDVEMCQDDPMLKNPNCPICKKGKLRVYQNKNTGDKFIGCSNYPKCNYHNNNMDIIRDTIPCSCGHFLVRRLGVYGEFYGCTNYPKCKNSYSIKEIDDRRNI